MKPLLLLTLAAAAFAAAPTYKVITKIKIGGGGRWDYAYVDSTNHRLYVSHGTQTEVIDTSTDKLVGTIMGTNGVHGIAIADDLGPRIHQRRRRQRRHGVRPQDTESADDVGEAARSRPDRIRTRSSTSRSRIACSPSTVAAPIRRRSMRRPAKSLRHPFPSAASRSSRRSMARATST